jgi:predicted RND superfamily exporter protein
MTSAAPDKPRLGSKHKILLRVERFSRRHYVVVFIMAALAIVAGGWLGSKLHIESNLLALIPAGNRQVDTLKEALNDFGSIDYR